MFKVKLFPTQQVIEVNGREPLLAQLLRQNIFISSSCGGFATCGECAIKVRSSELNCTSPTYEEIKLLGNVFHLTKERLSCQMKVVGDLEIDISHHDRLNKKGVSQYQAKVAKPHTQRRKPVIKEPVPANNEPDQNTRREAGFNRPKRKS